jgi:hypothetical protein
MMEKSEIKMLARAIVREMDTMHNADLAPKWQGASIFVVPQDSTVRDHEIPIDTLMHKIVMMRNNLRVLEQQVNASPTLSESEKIKFQSYITKCYGSMTSFNFLFWNDEDKFRSK